MKVMPLVPATSSSGAVHQVIRSNTHPANVIVRHPATVGPNMMKPREGFAEVPSGSISKNTPAGGITGGVAPLQTAKGAMQNEFVG